jgi:hypothetical protein
MTDQQEQQASAAMVAEGSPAKQEGVDSALEKIVTQAAVEALTETAAELASGNDGAIGSRTAEFRVANAGSQSVGGSTFPADGMAPKPLRIARLGETVYYTLTAQDAGMINRRRGANFSDGWPDGAQAHFGNSATPGDVLPARVVKIWGANYVNVRVELDGNDVLWKTSVGLMTEENPNGFRFPD